MTKLIPYAGKEGPTSDRVADRNERALTAGLELAKLVGFQFVTLQMVADQTGMSKASIFNCFGGSVPLKRAVLRAAIDRGIMEIVAQGLADRHPMVLAAPESVRQAAVQHLAAAE